MLSSAICSPCSTGGGGGVRPGPAPGRAVSASWSCATGGITCSRVCADRLCGTHDRPQPSRHHVRTLKRGPAVRRTCDADSIFRSSAVKLTAAHRRALSVAWNGTTRWRRWLQRSLILGLIVQCSWCRRPWWAACCRNLAPLFVPALVTGVSVHVLPGLDRPEARRLVAGPGPFRLGISVRPAGDARGLVAFRHPHERGGIRSGRDQLAALLADRGAAAQARDYRLGLLRAFSCPSTSCRSASTCGRAK